MAKITQIFFLIFCLLFFSCQKESKLKLGAERIDTFLPLLKNKRIGIVGNQTSMIGNIHLVDSLLSLGIDVVKVFSPEHGFRGKADAGVKIKDRIDEYLDSLLDFINESPLVILKVPLQIILNRNISKAYMKKCLFYLEQKLCQLFT